MPVPQAALSFSTSLTPSTERQTFKSANSFCFCASSFYVQFGFELGVFALHFSAYTSCSNVSARTENLTEREGRGCKTITIPCAARSSPLRIPPARLRLRLLRLVARDAQPEQRLFGLRCAD
jgi:hypothetical protein